MPNLADDGHAAANHVIMMASTASITRGVTMLRRGGVISFPTDTVYALAASLAHPPALARLFQIKRRPVTKPIPILLASASDLPKVARPVAPATLQFIATFWPGQLTVILPAHDEMPDAVTGNDDTGQRTVAVRTPDHSGARALIQRAGGAIAATSANQSGVAPALKADDVAAQLGTNVDLILDGGRSPGGVASTIVALNTSGPVVLREGDITADQLTAAWLALASEVR